MSKHYPVEQRERAVRMVLDHLDEPANIMLSHLADDDEQRILLADFGIARDINDGCGARLWWVKAGLLAEASTLRAG